MRQTRKQRLIAMRKTIGYHPHHPRELRREEFWILGEDKSGHIVPVKTATRAATSKNRRTYQSMKKAGV
jgi:hypothetical protein